MIRQIGRVRSSAAEKTCLQIKGSGFGSIQEGGMTVKRIVWVTFLCLSVLMSSFPGKAWAAEPDFAEDAEEKISETDHAEETGAGEVTFGEEDSFAESAEGQTFEETADDAGNEPEGSAAEPETVEEAPSESDQDVSEEEYVFINPLYKEVVTEADLKDASGEEKFGEGRRPLSPAKASSETLYGSFTSAGSILRNGMIGRGESVIIKIDKTADDFSSLENKDIYTGIIRMALEEDQDCRGGDYLRFHYAGFRIGVYSYTDSLEFRFTITYLTTAAQESSVDSTITQAMASFDFDSTDSEAEKVLRIYSYITENVEYDYENLDNQDYTLKYSAYAALINGKAVCQGYATLFYRMCREAGISVRVIAGTGISGTESGPHAWNIVRIGDLYYNTDATWDSGRRIEDYQWFLKGEDSFGGHIRSSDGMLDYTSASFCEAYPVSAADYILQEEETAITVQPDDVSAVEGEQVVLHIETSGPVLGYQWQWKKEGGSWNNCTSSGGLTDTFIFKMKSGYSGRIYRCLVSGNGNSIMSDEVRISLRTVPLAIVTHPESVSARAGERVVLHIEVSGSGISYQWQWSKDESTWKNCTSSGCSTDTFSFTMKTSLAGRYYRCIVSSEEDVKISDKALISLRPDLEIVIQPESVEAAEGQTVSLYVGGNSEDAAYQWQWTKDGKTWNNCTSSGCNKSVFSFRMKASLAGRTYRCILSAGGTSVISDGAHISLAVLPPEITVQPESVEAAEGDSVLLHVEASGSGISYQWQWTKDGKTWNNCTSSGCRTDTFRFVMKASLAGRSYRCIITNQYGMQLLSDSALISLQPVVIPEDPTEELPEDLRGFEKLSFRSNNEIRIFSFKYGSSVLGRDLVGWSIAPAVYDRTILLNFEIHGWEDSYAGDGQLLVNLGNAVVSHYADATDLYNCRLIVIPSCNPDGLAEGTTNNGFGRCNADGIDLNRDFDVAYQSFSSARNYTPYAFSGKESAALRDLVQASHPYIAIDFHGWENCTIGNSDVAEVFSTCCGLNHKNEFTDNAHGYFAYWAQSQGAKGLLVEFKNPESLDHGNVIRAIDRLIQKRFGTESEEGTDSIFSGYCPLTTYAISSGRVYVQQEIGNTGTGYGYIDGASDSNTIIQVYDNGWCKVRYPASGYTKTGFCLFSEFYDADWAVTPYKAYTSATASVYTKSDMAVKLGSVWSTDEITVIAEKNNVCQIIYPLDNGGCKMGWIEKNILIH